LHMKDLIHFVSNVVRVARVTLVFVTKNADRHAITEQISLDTWA
jgi:hypothetical protein